MRHKSLPSEDSAIELYDEETDTSVEVLVTFFFSVEPREYEGPYLFYVGGATLEHYELAENFEFLGKKYTELYPELFKYINVGYDFVRKNNTNLEKSWSRTIKEATKSDFSRLMDSYMDHHFETYIAPDLEVPSKRYPLVM